jgi:DNA-binding response OmpR family regulator
MQISKHVLVIDDEPFLRRSLSIILGNAGYLVSTAGSGAEALTCLSTGYFDLVFLDIMLPDTTGIELLPIIRRDQPDLPVLILTAHATLETAMEAIRHGARDYMIKPARPETILKRVQEILDEQTHPRRRHELLNQIQGLLSELQLEDPGAASNETKGAIPASDPKHVIRSGPLTLNILTSQTFVGDTKIHLPPTTFDYLVTLVRHSPNPVTYESLVQESQGYNLTRMEAREMAGWHIHQLRKALESNRGQPQMVITVRNVGYRFVS